MRRLCRGLAVSLPFFILTLGLFFSKPSPILAQKTSSANKIGTHLIQGDYNAQADVIRKLVSSGAVAAGDKPYPIVVMVDPSNPNGLSIIKTALEGSNFLVILRINVNEKTNSGEVGATINSITTNGFTGSQYPIVVGNEINNQDAEWKSQSYSSYGQMFTSICESLSQNPCGVSAMDTINSNFDAEIYLAKVLESIPNKKLITAVFANVYKTGGCSWATIRCGVDAGTWVQSKIKPGAPLYITEFGITRDLCDNFDCIQDFYEQNNDISAKAIVGFTRNPANAEPNNSDWYHTVPVICEYWKAGPGLSSEKPTKCGGGKRQSFVYPGIEDMVPDVSKMKSMAAGYTLMCGNQFKMQGNIENESALTNRPPGMGIDCSGTPPADYRCTVGGVFANVILDNTKTTIPLYRFQGATVPNPDSATRRMDDLEGFFSANYTKDLIQSAADTAGSQFIKPLANGVSRKLMSDQVQCESTLQYLESIRKLCEEEGVRSSYTYNDKLDADATPLPVSVPKPTLPPGECALYSKIPGGDSEFATYKDIIVKKPGDFSCTNSPPGLADSKWYKAFQKVEITAPKGFKPAYLVHYIDRPETPQTALDKRVVWQAPGEGKNGGVGDDRNISDRIKIVKVYVPAGFAEVNIDEVNKNADLSASEKQPTFFPTFSGGLMQTISALLPYQVQTEILKTRSLVTRTIERAMDGAIPGGAIKCESCVDKEPDDPRVMIIKRINAGISTSGQDACTKDDLISQTAAERQHTINPAGTLDPVMPAKITASATMVATKPSSEPETIKTFLLLPEEYRNIAEFEKPFLQTFLPYELQDTTDHPEFQFVSTKSELAKNPKAALKYLQLSGSRADVISPKVDGADLSYQVPGDYDPLLPPGQSPGPKTINGKLSGQIVADRSTSAILPDPQVPGGILARALWQIMCNVNRPHDKLPTVAYPGFEKFLQKGMAACTDGAKPTETNTSPVAAGSCNYGEAAVDRAIQNAALKYKVPPEMLLGIFQTEGLDYRIAPEKYVCKENWAQAAGVTQVTKGTYGIVTCPDERVDNDLASCQAPAAGKLSRCDVNGAFELAARVLLLKAGHWIYGVCDGTQRATAPIRNTNINEVYIAASYYYGSCNADRLTGNFSTGALQRGDILACRDGNCMNMGYGDFVCAFMAKKNGLDYCNRPDNFPSKAQCKF